MSNPIIDPKNIQDQPLRKKITREEIKNTGDKLKVEYSTSGRFTIPSTLYWKDYTVKDVNSLALSDQEDILKNLISILNELKDDENCKVEDMLYEEFIETLIFMKIRYNTSLHEHTWMCDCQNGVSNEEKQSCTSEINLKTLNFKEIENADKILQDYYKEMFDDMTKDEFNNYLIQRYKNKPITDLEAWTIEKEIKTIQIKEPFDLPLNNHMYTFNFTRIGDLLIGQEKANKKYIGRIKFIQGEKYTNKPLMEIKQIKETKINEIKRNIAKDTILFSRALAMIEKDGKVLSIEERIEEWSNFSRAGMLQLNKFFDMINFGLNEEKELKCSICGNTSRRLLQQEFNILELLPLQSDSPNDNDGRRRFNVFIRV